MVSRRLGGAIFRVWLVALGGMILLWSGWEDRDLWTVTALGWLAGASLIGWLNTRHIGARSLTSKGTMAITTLVGAASGAAANLATIALMIFKNARHAHAFPDFPPQLLIWLLEALPAWALAGALAGLGLGFLLRSFGATARLE